jgi:ribosomal protein S18 acetylase RimI-like enzyme
LPSCRVGGAKVSFRAIRSGQEDAAQLQKIYVLAEFVGERIGEALLRQGLPEARRRAPTIWLDVLHENKRAIGFYKKHGFAVTGEDTYTIGSQRCRFDLMTISLT